MKSVKGILSEQIELGMNGYRMTNEMDWEVLLKAASEGGSVESSSQEMGRCIAIHYATI